MEVNHRKDDSGVYIELVGELGHHEAITAMRRIAEIIDVHMPKNAVLDMSGITFMDSSGIAVVVQASKACREVSAGFCVKSAPKQARRVLDAAGIGKIISFV